MSLGHDRDRYALEGEEAAARHLAARGYRLLGRRLRTPLGEIDLLVERGELVVFVEVKTRSSSRFGRPAESITARKAEHIRRAALCLVQARAELRDRPLRIDVVEVRTRLGSDPEITHLEDAI